MSIIPAKREYPLVLHAVCVYCGSSNGAQPEYVALAKRVGAAFAALGLRLVYGGGHVGLMGAVADAALMAGGEVVGIIPEHIRSKEVQHTGLTKLHVVPDMHTRKRMMVDQSDAFVILPGGLGTLDEAFEILTWKKLRLHNKPIVLVNQNGFWDSFIALFDQIIDEGFATSEDRDLLTVVNNVDDLMTFLRSCTAPKTAVLTGMM